MCEFIKQRESYGRTENYVDVWAFAEALAPLIGATVENHDAMDQVHRSHAKLIVGDLTLYLRNGYSTGAGKVEVSSGAPKLRSAIENEGGYWPGVAKFADATVSVSRPLAVLAKDITRRVIEPATPILEAARARAKESKEQAAALDCAVAKIAAKYPLAGAQRHKGKLAASVHYSGSSLWFKGDLAADGSMRFETGTISADRARRILAILMELTNN